MKIQGLERGLKVLNVLLPHFAHGLTNGDIAKAADIPAPGVSNILQTLEAEGFVERITETNRWRPSHRLARSAVQILAELDKAQARIEESRARLTR